MVFVLRLGRSAKKKYAVRADLCGIYGADAERIRETDYELYVGLWLNRDRAIAKHAVAVQQGIFGSAGLMFGITLPLEYFLAACDTEDQAIHAYETSKQMSASASMSKG